MSVYTLYKLLLLQAVVALLAEGEQEKDIALEPPGAYQEVSLSLSMPRGLSLSLSVPTKRSLSLSLSMCLPRGLSLCLSLSVDCC